MHSGHLSGLSPARRARLMSALVGGALAEGFPTDLWMLPRGEMLIEWRFGRTCSESQVWRITSKFGFSHQRPASPALERDEAAIRNWKRTR